MTKVKFILETVYLCLELVLFSKILVNSDENLNAEMLSYGVFIR